MDNNDVLNPQKPRQGGLFSNFITRKSKSKRAGESSNAVPFPAESDLQITEDEPETRQSDQTLHSGDRKRTEERYKKAAKQIQESMKHARGRWEPFKIQAELFEVPTFHWGTDPTKDSLHNFRAEIEKVLEALKVEHKGYGEQIFKAISPVAKNFLRIAKQAQSVSNRRLIR
jgi:hypothetical protein